jgi:hypothetical protein
MTDREALISKFEKENKVLNSTNEDPDLESTDKKEEALSENTLNYRVDKFKLKYFLAFFLLGVFNNNGSTLVQSGSSSLAKSFNKGNFMGTFQFAMTFISFCTRFANGTILVNIKHMYKFRIGTCLTLCAFLFISFASYKGYES